MSKRKHQEEPRQERDEFQSYGQYDYTYQAQESAEGVGAPVPAASAETASVEAVKRGHKRHRVHVFFKLLILLCVLTVVIVALQTTVFRLKSVYVIGNHEKTPQQIAMLSGLALGDNIFSIDEEAVAESFKKDHTVIFQGMQKEYPDTVYIYVEERTSVAALQYAGMQYTLDGEGLVMTERNTLNIPEGMPVITGLSSKLNGGVVVGQMLGAKNDGTLEAYRSIMYELDQQMYADQVTEINLSDVNDILVVTAEGITVKMGNADYMEAKIGAIRTYMGYLRQLGKSGGMLDVSVPEDAMYSPEG